MIAPILLSRPLHPAGRSLLESHPGICLLEPASPTAWRAAMAEAEIAMIWLEQVDAGTLAAAPHLRAIARMGIGTDMLDLPACTARGIPVLLTPGANSIAVAEHAMMLLLATAHRGAEADAAVRAGHWWHNDGPPKHELAGRRALVVGGGRIGRRIADLCAAFSMAVAVLDPGLAAATLREAGFTPASSLETALPNADVVILACPLTSATHHLMNAATLRLLPRGALLVNVARGAVVEETALARALQEGQIAAAGLDVLEQEPPALSNPLLGMRQVVLTPHNAAATGASIARMAEAAARNVLDVLAGTPRAEHLANPKVLASASARGT